MERERGVHAMLDIFPIIRRGTAEPRRETAATAKTLLQTSSYEIIFYSYNATKLSFTD